MGPTLASLTHSVLEDHRRMNESIAALESIVRTARTLAGAPRGRVAGLVTDLRRRIGRHFAAEEEGGLFEQIERSAPDAAEHCARLRAQHAAILTALDRSRTELPPQPAASAALESWAASLRAVLAEVKAHEEREDALLLTALDGGRGAPD
jgi:hemerythrin HHE cation binding domain-containing protein